MAACFRSGADPFNTGATRDFLADRTGRQEELWTRRHVSALGFDNHAPTLKNLKCIGGWEVKPRQGQRQHLSSVGYKEKPWASRGPTHTRMEGADRPEEHSESSWPSTDLHLSCLVSVRLCGVLLATPDKNCEWRHRHPVWVASRGLSQVHTRETEATEQFSPWCALWRSLDVYAEQEWGVSVVQMEQVMRCTPILRLSLDGHSFVVPNNDKRYFTGR